MIDQNILYSECPCGSGKKFKFCCYPVVRDDLPGDPTRADVTDAIRQRSAAKRLVEQKDTFGVLDLDHFHELIGRGLFHLNSGDYRQAEDILLQAREQYGMFPTAYNNLALCALVQGHLDEAERWVREVVDKFPVENPFGLAMLADLRYLKGDSVGALDVIARAEQIEPPSVDQAVRVCESMAHFLDHARIIRYAEKSGYDDDPGMALFLGIARANVGRFEDAAQALRIAVRGRRPDDARAVLEDVVEGRRPSTICGDWTYFTPNSFTLFAGLVEMMEKGGSAQLDLSADVLAEFVEVETNGGRLKPAVAVKLLSSAFGKRAERVLNGLRTNPIFPETVRKAAQRTYSKLYEKGGRGTRMQNASVGSLQKTVITEEAATHAPLDPAYEESYSKAVRICLNPKSGKAKLKESLRLLEDLHAKIPDNPAVTNNYASALSRLGQMERAFEIVRDCFAQHPDYVFGAANYLRQLILLEKIDEAEALVANYRLPQRIHPDAYLAWMKTLVTFYEKTGDRECLRNTQEGIDLVTRQLGRR